MVFEGMQNETALSPKLAMQHSKQPTYIGSSAKLGKWFYVQVKLRLNKRSKGLEAWLCLVSQFQIG